MCRNGISLETGVPKTDYYCVGTRRTRFDNSDLDADLGGGGEMKNDNLGRSRDRIRVVVVCAAYRLRACSARLARGRRRARDTKTN